MINLRREGGGGRNEGAGERDAKLRVTDSVKVVVKGLVVLHNLVFNGAPLSLG